MIARNGMSRHKTDITRTNAANVMEQAIKAQSFPIFPMSAGRKYMMLR